MIQSKPLDEIMWNLEDSFNHSGYIIKETGEKVSQDKLVPVWGLFKVEINMSC